MAVSSICARFHLFLMKLNKQYNKQIHNNMFTILVSEIVPPIVHSLVERLARGRLFAAYSFNGK